MSRHMSWAALAVASVALGSLNAGEQAPLPPPDQRHISKALAKTLARAQAAYQRNDYAVALEELGKADAMPEMTAYDAYVIDQLRTGVKSKLKAAVR